MFVFLLFKQRTAYEMRISDWSSDVCSSDLLAPEGCIVKLAGHDREHFEGPARVFDSEEAAFDAVQSRTIQAGDVVVIRFEGPAGGPGMREMLAVTAAQIGSASCRGRVCQYVSISGVAVSLKRKNIYQ